MSVDPSAVPQYRLRDFGPFLLFTLVEWILLGIATVQSSLFFSKNEDPLWIRTLVGTVLWLVTARAIFSGVACLQNFRDNFRATSPVWPFTAGASCQVAAILLVQLWFARRLWLASKKRVLSTLTAFISLSTAATGFVIVSQFYSLHPNRQVSAHFSPIYVYTYVGNVVADILVTIPVVLTLRRSRGAISSTRQTVNRLMFWVAFSGAFTALLAIVCLGQFFFAKSSATYYGLSGLHGSYYANFLLILLNQRGIGSEAINLDDQISGSLVSDEEAAPERQEISESASPPGMLSQKRRPQHTLPP